MAGTSHGADHVSRWASGNSYGPVLGQTDLYLLNTPLELNPILTNSNKKFHLVFNLQTGQTGGFSPDARERDLPFSTKDEPATLPRVKELIVITDQAPWCTIVKNERGVTLNDLCSTIWKDYTDNFVTEQEMNALPARIQEQVRRAASHSAQNGWGMYYSPSQANTNRFRRVDWLRDRVYFEGLDKDDNYSAKRLGYKAPNIFVMTLVS